MTTPHGRLFEAARYADPSVPDELIHPLGSAPLTRPDELQAVLTRYLGRRIRQALVAGTLDRRLVLIERQDRCWVAADLSGNPHETRAWPAWTIAHLSIHEPGSWLSLADLDQEMVYRLTRPRLLLVALYHPEHFPLPRFPLGISDVARAARAALLGAVTLMDMQLGVTLDEVTTAVVDQRPDILGISATFGQHDLMVHLLDAVATLKELPLVVAGGSLTARNEKLLLERYPSLLIARDAGEPTIQDVLAYWHGDLPLPQVRGLGYAAANPRGDAHLQPRVTRRVANRLQTDVLPELDLLDATFRHKGVAQLESSRGCTNFCSFCPRSHKGQWWGTEPEGVRWILAEMDQVFRRHPKVSRTIFLVDEEFVGRGDDAVTRALHLAETLHRHGFRWETSCRIDQVVRTDRDRDWHLQRAAMWRTRQRRLAAGLK